MEILKYAVLGVVQGLTEFLPVSSSGHLVLFQHWLGLQVPGMTLEVLLHVATTVSVLIAYREDIAALLRERNWRYIGLILLACAVTALIFLPFKDRVEAFSDSPAAPRFVGAMLLVTGAWQLLADWRLRRDEGKSCRPLGAMQAAVIGLSMACSALFRGISRSGATIGTAIQLGVSRTEAARFSFLAGVPIILGGGILKAKDMAGELSAGTLPFLPLGVSFLCALCAGIAAIKLVNWALKSARLSWFGIYCICLGSAALIVG